MDLGLIQAVMGLGVGGVLAVIVVAWKRQDDKEHAATIVRITDERQKLLLQNSERVYAIADHMAGVLSAQTTAISELRDAVEQSANLSSILEEIRRQRGGGGD